MDNYNKIVFNLTVAILCVGICNSAWGEIEKSTRYLNRSASLLGPTGWINIPSAEVAEAGHFNAALHRGEAKLNLGMLDIVEGGIYFRADLLGDQFRPYRNLSSWKHVEENIPAFLRDAFRGQGKIKILDQNWAGISLAGGIEGDNTYLVIQRYISGLSRMMLLAGWGTGRFEKGFGGLSKTLFPGAELIFEVDGIGINVGLRMLLASNLILDLAVQNINAIGEVQNLGKIIGDHFLFGVTYVEELW